MKESLLQFIWEHQYFNAGSLQVSTGQTIQVLSPGRLNIHQGPDFLDARIRIGDTHWAGAVELHMQTSDWEKHAHRTDPNYRNVILHVVWMDDGKAAVRIGERDIPTLALETRVPKWLLSRYQTWMNEKGFIPCQQQAAEVDEATWRSWKKQLIVQRLQHRTHEVALRLEANHQHWEETCWWLMARSFGGPVNGAAFERIARSLPLGLLARQDTVQQLEALLLGQAGVLEQEFRDTWPAGLQKEFRYLRGKYRLPSTGVPLHFLRMRPGSFPTIRLAQLASIKAGSSSWFSRIKEAAAIEELRPSMAPPAAPYWADHYLPDRPSIHRVKPIGTALQDSIFINSFIPLLYAYGDLRDQPAYREKALRWLESIPAEKNTIIRGWTALGIGCENAGDSQALLELKSHYCELRNCLQCAIGKTVLGRTV